jgi:hypothetical protein
MGRIHTCVLLALWWRIRPHPRRRRSATIAEDVFKIGGNCSARAVACSWPAAARAPVKLLDNADVSIVNASPCS